AVVADGDFVNTAAEACDFDRELGLKTETVAAKLDGVENLTAKDFIANFHVGEVQVRQHIAEKRERLIADVVPVIQHAMGSAMKAITEHHIGKAFEDWFEKVRIITGVVFEIRVLDQDDVAGSLLESCP